MNTTDVKKITDIIAEERDVLIQLLSVSEQQKAFIIKDDIDNLGSLLETEGNLSHELAELEEKRVTLADALAEKYGQSERSLTLKEIADMTEDAEAKGKLLTLHSELSEMLKKQKRYNKTNQALLKRKKNYINVMLGALLQEEPIGNTYDSNGSVGNRCLNTGLFDQSV